MTAHPKSEKVEAADARSLIRGLKTTLSNNDLLLALAIILVYIIAGAFIGWYNNRAVPLSTNVFARYTLEPGNKLSFLSNWDGPNYINIARHGYFTISLTNFFPLYPLLIKIVHYVIPSYLISALTISWTSLVFAAYFYIKLLKELFGPLEAESSLSGLMLFLLFPTGIFLIATYTESLFAALALGTIYFAIKKKYLLSALMLMFCTATHVTGIFILATFAAILLENREKLPKIAGYTAIGSVGLLSYMLFLEEKFHKPLQFVTSQKSHGWLKGGYANLLNTVDLYNMIFLLLLIAAMVYWWGRRKSFVLYSFLIFCIPFVGKQFGGFNRYALMAFPIPLMIFGWTLRKRPVYYSVIIVLSSVSWTYFALQYAGGYIGG